MATDFDDDRQHRRRRERWTPDISTIAAVAAGIAAASALYQDATLRLVLWAFLP
jgi:hypothetical protein